MGGSERVRESGHGLKLRAKSGSQTWATPLRTVASVHGAPGLTKTKLAPWVSDCFQELALNKRFS